MPDKPEIFEHKAASSFWQAYSSLSVDVQALADKNFSLLKSDPRHPSLQFKKVVNYGLPESVAIIERSQSRYPLDFCGCGSASTRNTTN